MKKITLIGLAMLTTLSVMLGSCQAKAEAKAEAEGTAPSLVYTDTVHLNTAMRNITNYVQNCVKYLNDTVPIRSYTINKADLFGILGVTTVPRCNYEHCRVYIGMDRTNKFKLYMTPTVPRLVAGDTVYVDTILSDGRNNFVYDLNAPCPSTCDKGSRLYVRR